MEDGKLGLHFLLQLLKFNQQYAMEYYMVYFCKIGTILIEHSVIDGSESKKIFRLSDDEREWIEVGQIGEKRSYFAVASLNEKIYITGGYKG